MTEQYLWDGTGSPDPEIAALEEALRRYRYKRERHRRAGWEWTRFAVAAVVVIGTAVALMRPAPTAAEWEIAGARTYVGQVVRTAGDSVTLESEDVGRVEVAPASELRISESKPGRQRLALRRGTMHALIWAPARQFIVETPSAFATDLGCEYTLSVQPDGTGMLRVETGWVAFQHGRLESFIPAGAACRTRSASGPGIPFFEDASHTFRNALERYEDDHDSHALVNVLQTARPRDGLTLWHLLARTAGSERVEVVDRYVALIPLPVTVTPKALLNGDSAAIDGAWNALGLEGADWWREWKRKW